MSTVSNTNTIFLTKIVTDSITRPANTTAYAAGDAISEDTTNDFFTFSELCKAPNYSALISGAIIYSSANVSTKLDADLFLFASNNLPTEDADNAAWTPTDAELLTCIGVINFPTGSWHAGDVTSGAGGNAMCSVDNLGMAIKPGTGNVVGQLIARNAYVPVSGEVFTISLKVAQD